VARRGPHRVRRVDAASRIQADKNEARDLEAQERLRALDEALELWLAEDHIAFHAASRIQAVHSLVARERPCAQEKDNAQYLEQENDGLRIQMGVFCEREMDTVAAAKPETGVREMDTTAAARSSPWCTRTTTSRSRPRPTRRRAARSTSRSRARSRPTRARTPLAPRSSTSPSTPAPRSGLAPSHASGLTTKSTLRILLTAAFGPSFLYAGQT